MAITDPSKNPKNVLPNNLTESSSSIDSARIAIIGPNITALGEMVFIMVQIKPARQ